jgi:transcriptional regulator of acetoin/glycerol metabolism
MDAMLKDGERVPGTWPSSLVPGHPPTGTVTQKVGRFEPAHPGDTVSDEVGDIPLELQPELLCALQEQEFERLGSTRTVRVDVRLVAATNHDLGQMVQGGRLRSDLYYRLNVFPVVLPPLRERGDGIRSSVRRWRGEGLFSRISLLACMAYGLAQIRETGKIHAVQQREFRIGQEIHHGPADCETWPQPAAV